MSLCFPCSFSSTPKDATAQPPNQILHLAASTSASTSLSSSSSSEAAATAAASFDDAASILTLPSLPSLQSLVPISGYPDTSPFPASHLCLTSLKPLLSSSAAAALAVSAASSLLYSVSKSEITVFDLDTVTPIETFVAVPSAGSVKSVALSLDGKLFTAHQDGRIRVWRRSAGTGRYSLDATLPTAADRLRRFPLPRNYVAVRRHKKILWIKHADAVSAVAARGDLLYSVSWDKTLKVWLSTGDLRCLESVSAHEDAVNAVAVAGDGTVYTGSADGKIRVWAHSPEEDGRGRGRGRLGLVATLEKHRSAVNALALSGDGAVLYSGACDRSILVWERKESADHMAVAGALRGHGKAILCLACVGVVLFSGSSDRTVRIWRKDGEGEGKRYSCLGVIEGHATGVRSLVAIRVPMKATLPDSEDYRVCCGSLDGEVRVWRVRIPATHISIDQK